VFIWLRLSAKAKKTIESTMPHYQLSLCNAPPCAIGPYRLQSELTCIIEIDSRLNERFKLLWRESDLTLVQVYLHKFLLLVPDSEYEGHVVYI
jgi:hypothetical protein